MAGRPISWRVPIYTGCVFYVIHFVGVLAFVGMISSPANQSSMEWLFWYYVDFPIGMAVLEWAEQSQSPIVATLIYALAGGVMWFIWGSLVARTFAVSRALYCRRDVEGIRCPHCDYDLRGTIAARRTECPECGHTLSVSPSR